jgi:hypothetical protein
LPSPTFENIADVWYEPASRRYSYSLPVGLVTVTTAFPNPCEQSTVCAGEGGICWALRITGDDAGDEQPLALVTT